MCYSAQVCTSYRSYVREWGVDISIREYLKLYRFREAAAFKVYIPKGMDAGFAEPATDEEREIKSLIDQYNAEQVKKVERAKDRLADLRRTDAKDRDSRIFPGHYAPVMVMEAGKLVVKPMHYQCRPAGKPAFYDTKYPGTYNAFGALLTVRKRQALEFTERRCS